MIAVATPRIYRNLQTRLSQASSRFTRKVWKTASVATDTPVVRSVVTIALNLL